MNSQRSQRSLEAQVRLLISPHPPSAHSPRPPLPSYSHQPSCPEHATEPPRKPLPLLAAQPLMEKMTTPGPRLPAGPTGDPRLPAAPDCVTGACAADHAGTGGNHPRRTCTRFTMSQHLTESGHKCLQEAGDTTPRGCRHLLSESIA